MTWRFLKGLTSVWQPRRHVADERSKGNSSDVERADKATKSKDADGGPADVDNGDDTAAKADADVVAEETQEPTQVKPAHKSSVFWANGARPWRVRRECDRCVVRDHSSGT